MGKLDLTEKELSTIGWNRWLNKHLWRLLGSVFGWGIVILPLLFLFRWLGLSDVAGRCFIAVWLLVMGSGGIWILRANSRVAREYQEEYKDYIGK